MNEQDAVTLNMFAAAVMPPVGPHDTDAVLAERIKRAFAVAELMLQHSKDAYTVPPPIEQIMEGFAKDMEEEAAAQKKQPRAKRTPK